MFENPQALVAVITLGMVGFILLASKLFTKLWLYLLLLSPSWGITAYNILDAVSNGEAARNILLNHATGLIFILAPIDQHLILDPTLQLYGLALYTVWFYIILMTCKDLQQGWMTPAAPLIFWILGKGTPNTMTLLSQYLPNQLLIYNGLPLVILTCILTAAITYYIKKPTT